MILKFSILGMLILLAIVLTISYYTQLEGFDNVLPAVLASALTDGMVFTCVNVDVPNGTGVGSTYQYTAATNSIAPSTAAPTAQVLDCSSLTLSAPLAPVNASKAVTSAAVPSAAPVVPAAPVAPVAVPAATSSAPSPLVSMGPQGPQGPPGQPAPATGSDLSSGSSLVPPMGAGPAPYSTNAMPSTMGSGAMPQRNDVQPQIAMSSSSYDAMGLQQKSDLLANIQKIFRNELLASRSTDSSTIDPSSCASSDTDSTSQGNEYHKGKDMSKYIKKDSIPCYGCSLDY